MPITKKTRIILENSQIHPIHTYTVYALARIACYYHWCHFEVFLLIVFHCRPYFTTYIIHIYYTRLLLETGIM